MLLLRALRDMREWCERCERCVRVRVLGVGAGEGPCEFPGLHGVPITHSKLQLLSRSRPSAALVQARTYMENLRDLVSSAACDDGTAQGGRNPLTRFAAHMWRDPTQREAVRRKT